MPNSAPPLVGILMGSASDAPIMKKAAQALEELAVPYEMKVLSAHRTPDQVLEYAASARSRGLKILIAGAGGAAHLAGFLAAKTTLPVLAVPIPTTSLGGLDSLLSMVQMPAGVPVATLAIGEAGARNAAILAAQILALSDSALAQRLETFRAQQAQKVLQSRID